MNNELMILLSRMLQVLDNEIRLQYYVYEKYEGSYPSEAAIKILQDAEKFGVGKSKSLEIMNLNLADDINKERGNEN